MPQVGLQAASIVSSVRQREATCVSQHMRVHLDIEASGHRRTLQHSRKAGSRERCPSLRNENERRRWRFPLETAQGPHLTPGQGMRARRTALYPADVQGSPSEINLIPTQV